MLDKKKMRQDYKNIIPEKGVFTILNKKNGKVFLGSTFNLHNFADRNKFRLKMGSHKNELLQKDWKIYGEESFSFELMETLPLKDDAAYDYDEDLKILEMIWVEKYQPLAERCYNENENIRMV